MDYSHPPEKDGKGKPIAVFRHMGMSLAVFGAVLFSTGLVVCCKNPERSPDARCVLMFASGITMLISGLYIWRIAKQTD